MSSKRKRIVLFALTHTHHGFFRGVARYAREHQWHLVTDMVYTAKIPYGWRGDGIVSFIGQREDLADFILSSNIPSVEISQVRADLDLPRVDSDSEMIGVLAAEHFLARGYKHFAWAPMMDNIDNTERHRGFASRLLQEGLACHILPEASSQAERGGTIDWTKRRAILIRALKRLPKPLAIFCYNDCVAADIIDACEEGDLLVPEAVAVVGVDNDTILCECLRVPLSSVCNNLEQMAYEAAALLDRLMKGQKPPARVTRVPPTGIITRRSSDMIAVENLNVARALRHIADNFADPLLGVDDVVEASGISRRMLEKTFRTDLQRTVNEEIVRVRLARARQLLETTTMKVNKISAETGFTRSNHLFRVFRERVGMSPRTYRAQAASRRKKLGKSQ